MLSRCSTGKTSRLEVLGDGQWTVLRDGTIVGQRTDDLRKLFAANATPPAKGWVDNKSWLYTVRTDYGEFDLHLEYWTRPAATAASRSRPRGPSGD